VSKTVSRAIPYKDPDPPAGGRDDPIYFTVQKLSTNYMTSTILIPKFRDEGSRLRNKFFGSE
ncbi:hypothetical protein, partial [Balneola sp. EhC07]|uniref:hypothetical protein n=1 Tax=Balneola sp. EhC07 TaxID=1849360 RepID=UPI001F164494